MKRFLVFTCQLILAALLLYCIMVGPALIAEMLRQ